MHILLLFSDKNNKECYFWRQVLLRNLHHRRTWMLKKGFCTAFAFSAAKYEDSLKQDLCGTSKSGLWEQKNKLKNKRSCSELASRQGQLALSVQFKRWPTQKSSALEIISSGVLRTFRYCSVFANDVTISEHSIVIPCIKGGCIIVQCLAMQKIRYASPILFAS